MTDWNPNIEGQAVRLKANPGERGVTTGKVREAGNRLLVQIQFGANEKIYKPYNLLELCSEAKSVEELFQQKSFGTPQDLRRILTFEKVKGNLTNIFYSMESSNTNFYSHQFKPVLKFLESPVGRLLIADEVGLGKTIESIYIWKELQARIDARRLLIICPAILREKWRSDLLNRFNIDANILSCQELLEKVKNAIATNYQNSFIAIVSLEGMRPPNNWEDEKTKDTKAELARILDNNIATEELSIFDLTIIDEAHYLRNQQTANNRLARLMRDASRHLILLTATPIQIDGNNLYQLLKIISPEEFFHPDIFKDMMEANAPLIRATKLLVAEPFSLEETIQAIDLTIQSKYFYKNEVLKQIQKELHGIEKPDLEQRIKIANQLENLSLIGQYLTRTRKRDAIIDRVERAAQTLQVHLSPLEKEIYDRVTEQIREQTKGRKGIALYQVISRQRQMASSIVAAVRAWSKQGIINNPLEDDEIFWEDFGMTSQLISETESKQKKDNFNWQEYANKLNYQQLEKEDTKYQKLLEFLREQLNQSPREQFVLFAYYRETLFYLQKRLQQDGISVHLLVGDLGDEKWEILKNFQNSQGSILLSSEVGSEGIDLQFCRFLINYDLPWNPMRVEQRIGRLDRLGQKAQKISIINFSLADTIEEKILERLYERIEIFKVSIGDLENILGDITDKLLQDLFEPNLSEVERDRRAQALEMTIIKQKIEQEKLENEAINMLGLSEHILEKISRDRDRGRWLSPQDLLILVEDFFSSYYPGTTVERTRNNLFKINLSEAAKIDLQIFLKENRRLHQTLLTHMTVNCFFDAKAAIMANKRNELLDPTHPLIQWISHTYQQNSQKFHPVSAIEFTTEAIPSGTYIYVIHRWTFTGIKTQSRIGVKIIHLEEGTLLSEELSETILTQAANIGKPKALNLLFNWDEILEAYYQCDESLEATFNEIADAFEIENSNRCEIQHQSALNYTNRREEELQERLEKLRLEGKSSMIPAIEGLLKKVHRELEIKLKAIESKKEISLDLNQLAAGIIIVNSLLLKQLGIE